MVGYVIGKQPYYPHLKAFASRIWKPKDRLDILTRDNGFFMFKFFSKDDMDRVLSGGPYMFDGCPLVLKIWNRNVGLDRDIFASIPVWICFPNLRVQFWTPKIVS